MTDTTPSSGAFDAVGIGRDLLRTSRTGALATLDQQTGFPFASLVTIATDVDGSPLILVSRLSGHTVHLDADPRASILLAASGKGDPLAHPRLTVSGRIDVTEEARVRRRFLTRHPKARLYADFPDFTFRRMTIESVHLNGGFARAAALAPSELLSRIDDAAGLIEREEGSVAHINEDHADALALYATRLARAPAGEWRATGIDPDGIDLAAGDLTARVGFEERVTHGGDLRATLVKLAALARTLPS